jgi:hypothetical protein
MHAIDPQVDIVLVGQIAPAPTLVLVYPPLLQPADGGCGQSWRIVPQQRSAPLKAAVNEKA